MLVTVFYEELHGSAWFQAALAGALAAAVAIMVSTAWVFAEPHVKVAPWKAVVVVPGAVALALGVAAIARADPAARRGRGPRVAGPKQAEPA